MVMMGGHRQNYIKKQENNIRPEHASALSAHHHSYPAHLLGELIPAFYVWAIHQRIKPIFMIKIKSTLRIFSLLLLLAAAFNGFATNGFPSLWSGATVGAWYPFNSTTGIIGFTSPPLPSGANSDYRVHISYTAIPFATPGTLCAPYPAYFGASSVQDGTTGTNTVGLDLFQDSIGYAINYATSFTGTHDDTLGPGGDQVYFFLSPQLIRCATNSYTIYYYLGVQNQQYLESTTSGIQPPWQLAFSTTASYGVNYAQITWQKGSDIPDGPNLYYRIYRNGSLIDSVASGIYTYTDPTIFADTTNNYWVTTYTSGGHGSHSITWPAQESGVSGVSGTVHNNSLLQATQGTDLGKTHLSWPDIAASAPNGIAVSSDGQQLAVVNANSTSYDDYTGIPGVKYAYSISPIGANNRIGNTFTDSGYSKPNGQIKGNVNTPYNSPVSGVTIEAYATVDGSTFILDSTLTDASGYYEFDNLYYDSTALYTIVPHKGSHRFNPDTLTRTLSLSSSSESGANFSDTSVFTLKGTVPFYTSQYCSTCISQGVSMYVNGAYVNSVTDETGAFKITIENAGTYSIRPVLQDHIFSPDSIVINVSSDSFGIVFIDSTSDTLSISLIGGCHNTIDQEAEVTVTDSSGHMSYMDYFPTDTQLVVPAQVYYVTFNRAYSSYYSPIINFPDPTVTQALGFARIRVDLSRHDTNTIVVIDTLVNTIPTEYDTLLYGLIDTIRSRIDTTITTDTIQNRVWQRADFVYHALIKDTVSDFPLLTLNNNGIACSLSLLNNGYVLWQNVPVNITVNINESYADGTKCPVDSGQLIIYDDVSGLSSPLTVPFYNGQYTYTIVPGTPNVNTNATNSSLNYTLLLEIAANVDGVLSTNANTWGQEIVVVGSKPQTPTFVTTPKLPFFILHAPPGTDSYSFLTKDSSVTYNYSNSIQTSQSGGAYADMKVGVGIPVPMTGIVDGASLTASSAVNAGLGGTSNTSFNTTFTATQTIATINLSNNNTTSFVGHEGDVYYGASFNMQYALCDNIDIDTPNCAFKASQSFAYGATGMPTTYVYTEYHIVNTIIPQLEELISLNDSAAAAAVGGAGNSAYITAAADSTKILQSYLDVWNQVVQLNHRNTDTTSTFGQNISFSSGTIYENTLTSTSDSTQSINYTVFLDNTSSIGAYLAAEGDFDNTSLGVKTNLTWNMNKDKSTNVTKTNTIGYHLEDDQQDNYYSTNVNIDNAYGTPCFTNVLGASACPHWPGTQARDSVQITMDPYLITNVPLNQTANFTLNIMNESESNETRTYNIQAVPQWNLDGAVITAGGQQINNSPAAFTVPPNTTLSVLLSVAAGPVAADYQHLQVSASSACDGGEGNTISFTAEFQSACTPINIYTPSDNWIVNASNHDSLPVILSGYDINDTNLISIGLQYHSSGGGWTTYGNPESRSSLVNQPTSPEYYPFIFNTSKLADGNYEIRAFANCGNGQGEMTYSPVLSGTIDRTSFNVFGIPTPANGVLTPIDNISVMFNQNIDCGQSVEPMHVTLTRDDDSTQVRDTFSCYINQLIINTNPASLLDSLDNVMVTASVTQVYDVNGNEQSAPITWSFRVDRSKTFWSPNNMSATAIFLNNDTATATMINVGPQDTFTIIRSPSWLVPQLGLSNQYQMSAGNTLGGPVSLPVRFNVLSSTMNEGHYIDTVIALAAGRKEYLYVSLDVVSQPPHWYVNPASFQYNMNITANYSTTALDTPLSTNTLDRIAVFSGNQCRGVANISYDPGSNRYSAFITAYSNRAVGDTFTFRMWDALPGIEYGAVQRLPFINDGVIGMPASPYILNPAGEFQTIPLAQGWTWFSLDVKDTDMSPQNVLTSITGNNAAVAKGQTAFVQYDTTAKGWPGSITAFNNQSSYMIELDHPDTLHFLGQFITGNTTVPIVKGWNWVGFPEHKIVNDSAYLSSYTASSGDILKSQTQFDEYSGQRWSGSLLYMFPGQGYRINSADASSFVIPPYKSLPAWNVAVNSFQQNETVTADLQFNGYSTAQSHYLVGAFSPNGTCLGTGQPQFIAALNLYRIFLTIQGDTGNVYQPLTFKVWDTDNDVNLVPTYTPLSIVPDTVVGNVGAPYVINIQTNTGINTINYNGGYSLAQNVPNPFSKTTSIEYNIPYEQAVTINLYDESGRLIKVLVQGTQPAGTHQMSFEQDHLQPGIYFYQMKSGDFVKTKRMLIF
jgi:hypothetical protein